MKKIFFAGLMVLIVSCSPYQRMILNPANLNGVLEDSCDMLIINQLKQAMETTSYGEVPDQNLFQVEMFSESECTYYTSKLYPPRTSDSAIWLLTIRLESVGKKEIILGNLFTIQPEKESTYTIHRRMKEYSQTEEFESGKYMVFTYFIENDSTTIVKLGKREF